MSCSESSSFVSTICFCSCRFKFPWYRWCRVNRPASNTRRRGAARWDAPLPWIFEQHREWRPWQYDRSLPRIRVDFLRARNLRSIWLELDSTATPLCNRNFLIRPNTERLIAANNPGSDSPCAAAINVPITVYGFGASGSEWLRDEDACLTTSNSSGSTY